MAVTTGERTYDARLCEICGARMIHQTENYWYCPSEGHLEHIRKRRAARAASVPAPTDATFYSSECVLGDHDVFDYEPCVCPCHAAAVPAPTPDALAVLSDAHAPTATAGFTRPFSWQRTKPGLVRGESWTVFEADGAELAFCAAEEDARFIAAALDFAIDALAVYDAEKG